MTTKTRKQTKRKTTTKTTTNKVFEKVDLTLAESKDFIICTEIVDTPIGPDKQYALINKRTGVVEARSVNLSITILALQNSQQFFDKILSGEANGYAIAKQDSPINGLFPGEEL